MAETREITFVINSALDDELTKAAESMGRDKSTIARDALIEWLEDQEDIREAERIIAEGNATYSLEEVKRHLGLED